MLKIMGKEIFTIFLRKILFKPVVPQKYKFHMLEPSYVISSSKTIKKKLDLDFKIHFGGCKTMPNG